MIHVFIAIFVNEIHGDKIYKIKKIYQMTEWINRKKMNEKVLEKRNLINTKYLTKNIKIIWK